MQDDSWKDSYDSWKLASPDDEYDDPCDHEDYDIDIVSGRAECHWCGEGWYASNEEVLSAVDAQAAYAEYEERENRRQWWGDLVYNIRHPLQALHWQFQKLGWIRRPTVTDDDIPF